MNSILNIPGFLGTHATFRSDATLVLILFSILLMTIGWQLRLRNFKKAHCAVQAAAVILNTAVVASVMIGLFIAYILPGIPAKLLTGTYGITTLHAVVGAIAVVLGIFVVLRAYQLVPKALRFHDYKLFMRASYLLYLLSALLGVVVYLSVYTGAG
jgi:uncharacterized membrane protein YozB (DUF420 family)